MANGGALLWNRIWYFGRNLETSVLNFTFWRDFQNKNESQITMSYLDRVIFLFRLKKENKSYQENLQINGNAYLKHNPAKYW